MSKTFREYLRKIGSGPHTGENLVRQEAADATRLMLLQEATPAQIGAFLIAHRIKRPTGEELAGMLDAYDELGPRLGTIATSRPMIVMGSPYDGRSRTASLSPLVALLLATVDCLVIQHGGDRMPTKEGVPLVETWLNLGVDWTGLSLDQVQTTLAMTGLGFVYLPAHFPLAYGLVPYREQIGKRPPLATLELMWIPYAGDCRLASGFVHPPTEIMIQEALKLRGMHHFATVKGLEGSCDLPRERTAIIGMVSGTVGNFERLHLHPRDHGFTSDNALLEAGSTEVMRSALQAEPSELLRSTLWNGGFYLWWAGIVPNLAEGIVLAQDLFKQGAVLKTLQSLQTTIAQLKQVRVSVPA